MSADPEPRSAATPAAAGLQSRGAAAPAQKTAVALHAYECPNCGGDAHWNPIKHALVCSSCGSTLPPPKQDNVTYKLKQRSLDEGLRDAPTEAEVEREDDTKIAVACGNCHAVSYFDVGTAADRCQFCGSSAIVPYDALGDRERPQCVIPFQFNEFGARESARKWYRSQWLAPRKFRKAARMDVVHGMYLPFWNFDADARGRYADREGHTGEVSMRFDGVLICGAEDVPTDLLEKIEPFPADLLRSYDGEYIAGWTVARNRMALASAREYAHGRMQEKLLQAARKMQPSGKNSHNLRIAEARYANETYSQALLPVWLMSYTYYGKPFTLVVNGATGKAEGKSPKSWVKIAIIVVILGWIWLFFQDPETALKLPVWIGQGIWSLIKWPFGG
jgi:hypothetical protein